MRKIPVKANDDDYEWPPGTVFIDSSDSEINSALAAFDKFLGEWGYEIVEYIDPDEYNPTTTFSVERKKSGVK